MIVLSITASRDVPGLGMTRFGRLVSVHRSGYRSVMSMSRGPNVTRGESGSGWYLPPYGGADGGGIWPGTWQRDLDAELETRGCDKKGRNTLVMGGSAAAWSSDSSTFEYVRPAFGDQCC